MLSKPHTVAFSMEFRKCFRFSSRINAENLRQHSTHLHDIRLTKNSFFNMCCSESLGSLIGCQPLKIGDGTGRRRKSYCFKDHENR